MANRPTADLERFGKYSADSKRNRAICDVFEPGSTFKIVTAAALLDQGLVRPSESFFCENGRYKVRNRTYNDHKRFGSLSFREVLENSSNIGTIKASSRLRGDVFMTYVRNFGFGEATGVLYPGEVKGVLPDLNAAPAVHKASLAIGYGISTTAIQLVSAVATVANSGVRHMPSLVEGTRDESGRWTPREAGEPRVVMKADTAQALSQLLEGVVLHGTGEQARVPGYRIAGKTGTTRKYREGQGYGQTGKNSYITSFAGFGPVRDPRLALLVVVDNPRKGHPYGGEIAAPVFSRIMSEAFRHLRIPPDTESMVIVHPGTRTVYPATLAEAAPGKQARP
jgi:cell division protein FtsI/penicillin-binding protein 2